MIFASRALCSHEKLKKKKKKEGNCEKSLEKETERKKIHIQKTLIKTKEGCLVYFSS